MAIHFTKTAKRVAAALLALCLFAGGYVAGQTRLGEPKTIIHVVEIKWNPGVPDSE